MSEISYAFSSLGVFLALLSVLEILNLKSLRVVGSDPDFP